MPKYEYIPILYKPVTLQTEEIGNRHLNLLCILLGISKTAHQISEQLISETNINVEK